MNIVLIVGSPDVPSRVTAVADYVSVRLREYGAKTSTFDVNAFDSEALLHADMHSPAIRRFQRSITVADAVVIAAPVYQSSFSGVVKLLLELIPQNGLKNKLALPIAVSDSPHHLLILDQATEPVLSTLDAENVLGGVHVTSNEPSRYERSPRIEGSDRQRLDKAVEELTKRLATVPRVDRASNTAVAGVPYDIAQLIRSATG